MKPLSFSLTASKEPGDIWRLVCNGQTFDPVTMDEAQEIYTRLTNEARKARKKSKER